MVLTAPKSKNSSGMFRRFVTQAVLLRQFWQMEVWCHGVLPTLAATARKSKSSSGMFSRFVAHDLLLLRFCQMELWLPGAMDAMAVTVPRSKVSSATSRHASGKRDHPAVLQGETTWRSPSSLLSQCWLSNLEPMSGATDQNSGCRDTPKKYGL